MTALETSTEIEIVMIQTDTVMGVGTVTVMARAGSGLRWWPGRYDDRGSRAYERLCLQDWAVAEEHVVVGAEGMLTAEEVGRCEGCDDRSWSW